MLANRTGTVAGLAIVFISCLLISSCEDNGREAECGNGVIEAGEGCDGTAMPEKTCRDFGFTGGELSCSGCALVMDGCTKCGDSYIDSNEQCDRENLGNQTCADLGYFGGELACFSDCTFDTSGCLDCGGADPCAGATCSGHGACRLSGCEPWCECDEGYLPGYGLLCREEGSCLGLGEECMFPLDCCLGSCIKLGYDLAGRCGMLECKDDAHCASLAPEGATMCCMEHFDTTACLAVAAGETCGDRSGTCGVPCTGQFQSACAPGLACVSSGADDPFAACARPCSTDADCLGCADPADPLREFSCQMTIDGFRACLVKPFECERTQDCPDGLVCGVRDNADMTGLVGNCLRSGALDTGEACTFLGVNTSLPYDELCASEYCWFGHCSEVCLTDADCPQDWYCTLAPAVGKTIAGVMPFCVKMQGSETPCGDTADCPAGEVCAYNRLTPEGEFSKVCKTANCDPTQPDCLGPGDECDQGFPPCWDGFCANTGTSQFCSALCEDSPGCPRGMLCGTSTFPDGTPFGLCFLMDGSGDTCGSDADCTEAGEVCAYYVTYAGVEALCSEPLGDGQLGEPCVNVACASGICLSDGINTFCSTPCQVEADCPDSWACFTVPDPMFGPYPACAIIGGSQDPCTGDLDCTAPGEACFPYFHWDQPLDGRCVVGMPGGASPGEACVQDMNCFTRFCLTGPGYCTALCFTNPDCAVYGMECRYSPIGGWGPTPSCHIPDADSPLCTLCATDADCGVADARCIASVANPGEKYCGKPCATAADCPADHSCVDVGGVNNCKPDTDTCVPE